MRVRRKKPKPALLRLEIKVDNEGEEWRESEWQDLKKGMIFRLFNPDNTPVVQKKRTEFTALENASQIDGVWGVDFE